MHRGKGVGLHYYVRQTLGYANNEQMQNAWLVAMATGEGLEDFAQRMLDAHRSFFKGSDDAEPIIDLFKKAIECETGLTLR